MDARTDKTDPSVPHPVLRAGPWPLLAALLADWAIAARIFRFLGVVLRKFFIDQFIYRAQIAAGSEKAPPLKNVEHELDRLIPVRYDTSALYLSFIMMWISALGYFRKAIGRDFDPDVLSFLDGLERCYVDAAQVYAHCVSTTRRPDRAPSLRLAFVYAVDPHLFCVPSLHVMVVGYTWKKLSDLLAARGLADRFSAELAALHDRAVRITESILYVRQHSVNCIPAGFSLLGGILTSFGQAETDSIAHALFAGEPQMSEQERAAVLSYMDGLYRQVSAGSNDTSGRIDAINAFMDGYRPLFDI